MVYSKKRKTFGKKDVLKVMFPARVCTNERAFNLTGTVNAIDFWGLSLATFASGAAQQGNVCLTHNSAGRYQACLRSITGSYQADTEFDAEYQTYWESSVTTNEFTNVSNYPVTITAYEVITRKIPFDDTQHPVSMINVGLGNTNLHPVAVASVSGTMLNTITNALDGEAHYGKKLSVSPYMKMSDIKFQTEAGFKIVNTVTKKLMPGQKLYLNQTSKLGRVFGETFDSVNPIDICRPVILKMTCPWYINAAASEAGPPEGLCIWRIKTRDVFRITTIPTAKIYRILAPMSGAGAAEKEANISANLAICPNQVGNQNQLCNNATG